MVTWELIALRISAIGDNERNVHTGEDPGFAIAQVHAELANPFVEATMGLTFDVPVRYDGRESVDAVRRRVFDMVKSATAALHQQIANAEAPPHSGAIPVWRSDPGDE